MPEIDFAALQMRSQMSYSTVESTRKQMNEIVQIYKSLPMYREYVRRFAENVRHNISIETFIEADAFFVDEDVSHTVLPVELRHDALGFSKGSHCIYDGRFVYPVKDVKGDVMGWCGYDAFEAPKYLDSKNFGYVANNYTIWLPSAINIFAFLTIGANILVIIFSAIGLKLLEPVFHKVGEGLSLISLVVMIGLTIFQWIYWKGVKCHIHTT